MSPSLMFPLLLLPVVLAIAVGAWMVFHQPVMERFPRVSTKVQRRSGARRSPMTVVADSTGRLLAPTAASALGPARLEAIERKLDAAGRPGGVDATDFAGRKAAYAAIFAGVGVLLALNDLEFIGLALPLIGWFLPDLDLSGTGKERQEAITRQLPDYLDVLSVTVSAGLDFRAALARVADSFDGPLSDEIRLALQQMMLGEQRRDALAGLRRRNPSESLGEFVTALQQAEDLGAPLTSALTDIAADVRRSYAQEARRAAAKVEPRLSVLTTLALIPASLVVIGVGFWIINDISLSGVLGGG